MGLVMLRTSKFQPEDANHVFTSFNNSDSRCSALLLLTTSAKIARIWTKIRNVNLMRFSQKIEMLISIIITSLLTSVVTDSEFTFEPTNFSPVHPNPNPRIFGGRKWRFWNVCSITLCNLISQIYITKMFPSECHWRHFNLSIDKLQQLHVWSVVCSVM